jgi:hypothetical protein
MGLPHVASREPLRHGSPLEPDALRRWADELVDRVEALERRKFAREPS